MHQTNHAWAVIGANGMLGSDVVDLLRARGQEVQSITRESASLDDPTSLKGALEGVTVAVNCAAYTAVDAAETDEPEAHRVNAVGAGAVAQACSAVGARLVHVSTDYVFRGDADQPYSEAAQLDPISAYGRTKAAGERQVQMSGVDALVVRTAWLYGTHGPNFPVTIARIARERGEVSVVSDQHGQPTWTQDLADLMIRLIAADAPAGIYHGTSSGSTTWFGFAQAVVESAGFTAEVLPTTSDAFQRPAPRPTWSVLGHDALTRIGVAPIGDWNERWKIAAGPVLGTGA